MLDLTKEEKLVLVFVTASFLIGSGVNFFNKRYGEAKIASSYAELLKDEGVAPEDFVVARDKININTADINGLISVKGIGVKTAERIIEYRQQHGPFFYKEDIMKVKGIGKGKFEAIEKSVTTQ